MYNAISHIFKKVDKYSKHHFLIIYFYYMFTSIYDFEVIYDDLTAWWKYYGMVSGCTSSLHSVTSHQ